MTLCQVLSSGRQRQLSHSGRVPGYQCSMADLRPKGPWFWLGPGHLRVGKLHYWQPNQLQLFFSFKELTLESLTIFNSSSKLKPPKISLDHFCSSYYTFPAPASPAAVSASSSYQHLQTSPSFSSSFCIFQLPALADQSQLQQQFLHLPATSTCRPVPASAAVSASSSYQHLQTSPSFSSSFCIFQLPALADQSQLQQQFLHLPATSTCRPVPASAAVSASSSYQHLQTSPSFSSSFCIFQLPALADQSQLQQQFLHLPATSTCRPVPASAAVSASSSYQHLQTSPSFSSSFCIFQLPALADQSQLQQQFLHLPATSSGRPAPASAAVPASSSYQHLQTSSSFTSRRSNETKLPAPTADQHQLHPASDFCITLVYEQPLLELTQRTEATLTHLQLTKVLHNRVSNRPAPATSNWIFISATWQSRITIQTTSSFLNGQIFCYRFAE